MSKADWPFDPDVPLHRQIHAALRAEIVDGLYVGGGDFPGEVELADRFNVSVITTRAVLQKLAREGLLSRGRGRRPEAIFIPQPAEDKEPLLSDFHAFHYDVIKIEEAIGPAEACIALGVAPGAILWQCVRRRMIGDEVHSVTWSAQLPEIGRQHDVASIPTVPMPDLLARAGYPVPSVSRDASVAMPPPEIAAALGITLFQSVLLVRVIQSTGEQAVDWSRIFYHPDHHQPLETMRRETGS